MSSAVLYYRRWIEVPKDAPPRLSGFHVVADRPLSQPWRGRYVAKMYELRPFGFTVAMQTLPLSPKSP